MVAKDYFVYVTLREITARYPDAVFKGETSLSKCHKTISRFSEDVDLGVEAEQLSQGEHKKVKAAVTGAMEALGLSIPNIDETRSRRDYNKYVVELPYDVGAPGLSRDLIIETAFMTPVAPAVQLPVGCLIGECYSVSPLGSASSSPASVFGAHVGAPRCSRGSAPAIPEQPSSRSCLPSAVPTVSLNGSFRLGSGLPSGGAGTMSSADSSLFAVAAWRPATSVSSPPRGRSALCFLLRWLARPPEVSHASSPCDYY